MICHILYRDSREHVVWRVDAHPHETRKHIQERLKKFAPEGRLIDYHFGELTEVQLDLVQRHGKFPNEISVA